MAIKITQHTQAHVRPEGHKFFDCYYAESPVSQPELGHLEEGHSIQDAINLFCPEVPINHLAVYLNHELVSDFSLKPIESDKLIITVVPAEPLSLGAILLIGLIAGAAFAVGYYLFRPEEVKQDSNERLASIRGARNRARKYEPFRAVFGKRTVTPDFIAEPYTIRKGQDEYFKILMSVGYGPLRIRDMKIGETPLSSYQHRVAVFDSYENNNVNAIRNLWPAEYVQEDINITLNTRDNSNSENVNAHFPMERFVGANATSVIADFIMPRGLTGKDEHRAISVDCSYINPVTFTIGGVTVQSGDKIRVARLSRTNVSNTADFVPLPNQVIRMSNGTYRKMLGTNRNSIVAWASTRGAGVNNTRNVLRRSSPIPDNAIIAVRDNFVYINMRILAGQPRTIYDLDNGYEEVPYGSWSTHTSFMAYGRRAKSNRQHRFSVDYRPLHVIAGITESPTFSTTTTKTYPANTPDDAALVDEVHLNNIKITRDLNTSQFQKLIGWAKPKVGGDTFRPAVIALEIKATDQLSGMIDNFNVEATSVVPSDWNSDWRNWRQLQLAPTENPADAYRWLLQGPFTDDPFPNSKIDLNAIKSWRDICAAAPPPNLGYSSNNQWRISYEMLTQSTLQKQLGKIAYTGRAEYSYDGKFGITIRNKQTIPVQLFTPKNSWDFQASRVYPEKVDGIRYEWDNETKGYQQDEDYFYDPRVDQQNRIGKFDAFTFEGVPDRNMAFRLARFNYYENTLQRERYVLNVDAEGLVARRGSYVRIQHDVIDVGLGTGRIKEIGNGYIVIDEINQLSNNENYFDDLVKTWDLTDIFFEGSLGATFGLQFRSSNGNVGENAVSATYQGDGRFELPNSELSGLGVGDLVVYGDLGREYIDAIVVGIEYTENLGAKIYMTNYDKRVFEYDENLEGDNPIPEFESQLAIRPFYLPPNPPVLETIDNSAGIDIAKQQLSIAIGYGSQIDENVESFIFQFRTVTISDDPESDWEDDLSPVYDVSNEEGADWEDGGSVPYGQTNYILQGIERGTAYRIRARARGKGDLFSSYSEAVNVFVDVTIPPASIDSSSMSSSHSSAGILVKWGNIIDPDFLDYEVRTNQITGSDDGLIGNTTSPRLNIGYVEELTTVYVYARTVYNTYSTTPATIQVDTVYIPPSVEIRPQIDSRRGTEIRWNPVVSTPSFSSEYLDYYEVRSSADTSNSDTLITTVDETSYNIGYVNANELTSYYIYPVSVAGYRSNSPLVITPTAPLVGAVRDLISVPIDNVAAIDWEQPATIIYPISGYEVEEKKPSRTSFEPVGVFAATFINLAEREGGIYSFRVRAVDFAGNVSPWSETTVTLYNPTDFVLFYNATLEPDNATVTNGVVDEDEDGNRVVYFSVSPSKTIQQHINEVGGSNPTFTNKNTTIGNYFPQKTVQNSSCKYEQVLDTFDGDIGTDLFLRGNVVELRFAWEKIDGNNPVVTSRIYWSETTNFSNASFEEGGDGNAKAFIDDDFRYIKVEINFDTSNNADGKFLGVLNEMELVVDVKQKTDQGKALVTGGAAGTEIFFNKDIDANTNQLVNRFLDIDAVTATARDLPRAVVHTSFEYPDGQGGIVRDRFKAFIQDSVTGAFVNGEITWIARGK